MAFGDLTQTAVADVDANTTIDATFGAGVTTGSLIVSTVFTGDGPMTPSGDLVEAIDHHDTGQDDGFSLGYRVVQGGDGDTWGWTQPSADQGALINREWEGAWEASPLDVTDTTAFADEQNNTQVAGPTSSTAQNDELVIAAWGYRNLAGFAQSYDLDSVSDTFINLLEEHNQAASGAQKSVATASKLLTATGTPQTTATWSGPSDWTKTRTGACMAAFKKAAAAADTFAAAWGAHGLDHIAAHKPYEVIGY